MNGILDDFLVGLVLIVSAGYAVFSLGPRSLRGRTSAALSRAMERAPAWFGVARMARWLAAASADKTKGACGGCDNCGSEKTPASSGASSTSVASAAGMSEVRVPLAKIGKRAARAGGRIQDLADLEKSKSRGL